MYYIYIINILVLNLYFILNIFICWLYIYLYIFFFNFLNKNLITATIYYILIYMLCYDKDNIWKKMFIFNNEIKGVDK